MDDAVGAGITVDAGDVFPAGSSTSEAGVGRIHDPLPRGLDVVAVNGLAIGPLHARAQGPGNVHARARELHAAVVDGRDVRGQVRDVLQVRRDVEKSVEHAAGNFDVCLRLGEVRIDGVRILPLGKNDRAAGLASCGRLVGRTGESNRGG